MKPGKGAAFLQTPLPRFPPRSTKLFRLLRLLYYESAICPVVLIPGKERLT